MYIDLKIRSETCKKKLRIFFKNIYKIIQLSELPISNNSCQFHVHFYGLHKHIVIQYLCLKVKMNSIVQEKKGETAPPSTSTWVSGSSQLFSHSGCIIHQQPRLIQNSSSMAVLLFVLLNTVIRIY